MARKQAPILHRIFVTFILSSISLCGTNAQRYLPAGDDEYIRVNLSESFVYYAAIWDTLFVSLINDVVRYS